MLKKFRLIARILWISFRYNRLTSPTDRANAFEYFGDMAGLFESLSACDPLMASRLSWLILQDVDSFFSESDRSNSIQVQLVRARYLKLIESPQRSKV